MEKEYDDNDFGWEAASIEGATGFGYGTDEPRYTAEKEPEPQRVNGDKHFKTSPTV